MEKQHEQIEAELERLNLDPQWRGRYWYIRCPFHEDNHKSAQVFEDGWIHCHAGCPRRHINSISNLNIRPKESRAVSGERPTRVCDFTDLWLELEPIETPVKGVPDSYLRRLGWKQWPDNYFGIAGGYFIPYFNTTRSKVLYYQIRHDTGDRRFTFARGCSPICYGLECLPKCVHYLVFTEGSRDSVILRMAGVPAISIPSASSGALLGRMADYCRAHHLILVSVGDRDEAGDKLISTIKGPFIDARTPIGKDVGDFYAEKGLEAVADYYSKYKVKED